VKNQTEKVRMLVIITTALLIGSIMMMATGLTDEVKSQTLSKFNQIILDKSTTQYKAIFYVYDSNRESVIKVTSYSSLVKYLTQTYNVPTSEFKLNKGLSNYWCSNLSEGAGLSGNLIDDLQKCKCEAQVNPVNKPHWDFAFENEKLGVRILVKLPSCKH